MFKKYVQMTKSGMKEIKMPVKMKISFKRVINEKNSKQKGLFLFLSSSAQI